MSKCLLASCLVWCAATVAEASFTVDIVPVYSGYLSDGATYVFSYDLKVTVSGGDAWTVAGGPEVGQPWITMTGGTFYQHAVNDSNPINPAMIPYFPDSQWSSFYTTHLGYPNTASMGLSPIFAIGPDDTDATLTADWFWTPDGNDYDGTFKIARFTIIPTQPAWWAVIDLRIGSRDTGMHDYVWWPEPGSLSLLALGGVTLFRRQ